MATTPTTSAITRSMRVCFVPFPHVKNLLQRMGDLYAYSCANEEPENIFVLGESGVGKSRLLTRFRDMHPPIDHAEFTEIPVLYVRVPARSNIEKLASAMLQALGSPFWDKGKEKQLTYQLKCLLRACKVKLIIIDEMNHLVDKGGIKTHHTIADWIKDLVDEIRVPMVLAGIPRAERLLHTNDQLRSRFREVITIKPFSVENTAATEEFRNVLKTFSKLMAAIPSVDLSHPELTHLMAFATAGRLRDIRRLLVRAVELSTTGSLPQITMQRLAESFCEVIYPDAPEERNPFSEKFKKISLTRHGEPFAPREE